MIRCIRRFFELFISLLQTIITIMRVIRYYTPKLPVENSEQPLYIIANGPSFNDQMTKHPAFFFNKDIMCVNNICKGEFYEKLRPKYYCMMDPGFWEDDEKLRDEVKILREQCFRDLVKKTSWKMSLIIPRYAKSNSVISSLSHRNKNISILYTPVVTYQGFKRLKHYFLKLGLCNFYTINVCIGALSAAMAMGYKKIYLLGAEHDWCHKVEVDEENNLVMEDNHSYEMSSKKIVLKHMDGTKEYLHELLKYNSIGFQEYCSIEKYAKKEGIQIFNATPGSFIDAFRRVNIFK